VTIATTPRARSENQDVRTPPDFIAAVERRFGVVVLDLAAKDGDECKFGVDHITPGQNSLLMPWPLTDLRHGVCWLNPPFADIEPWAAKCAAWRGGANGGCVLAMLVPASVASGWWRDHVRGHAITYALAPRITFLGSDKPYPKDLALCVYDPRHFPTSSAVELWRWKGQAR